VGKPERKLLLGRPIHRQMDNNKIDHGKMEWGGMDWMDLAQGSCTHDNELLDSISSGKFSSSNTAGSL
jgi:hypothetical protein